MKLSTFLTGVCAGILVYFLGCAAPPDLGGAEKAPNEKGTADAPAGDGANRADSADGPGADGPSKPSDLFHRTFGDPSKPAVVFLHGGPGASSFGFEESAAQALADRGHFVVAYDQRGSTRRPKGTPADYGYTRATQDLRDLIATLKLVRPALIGHSFGGSIALRFLELHPGIARGVVLACSPMDFPATYLTILENAATRYRSVFNFPKASEMDALRSRMFPRGLTPPFTYGAGDIATVAEQLSSVGLAHVRVPTLDALALSARIVAASDFGNLMSVNPDVGNGFQANDAVGHKSFLPLLERFRDQVFAVYGAEDGIFDTRQLDAIASTLPRGHFVSLEDAAHYPFVDQRDAFVDAVAQDLAALK